MNDSLIITQQIMQWVAVICSGFAIICGIIFVCNWLIPIVLKLTIHLKIEYQEQKKELYEKKIKTYKTKRYYKNLKHNKKIINKESENE